MPPVTSIAPVRSDFAADPAYRDILVLFADALPERRKSMIEAFRSGNLNELRTLAHQLKGAGGGFGFLGLTELAADLELACREGPLERTAEALDRVLTYLTRIAI